MVLINFKKKPVQLIVKRAIFYVYYLFLHFTTPVSIYIVNYWRYVEIYPFYTKAIFANTKIVYFVTSNNFILSAMCITLKWKDIIFVRNLYHIKCSFIGHSVARADDSILNNTSLLSHFLVLICFILLSKHQ